MKTETEKYKELLNKIDQLINISIGFIGVCVVMPDRHKEAVEFQKRMEEIVTEIEKMKNDL